ncbi:MAG TPA: hypothetical protein VLH75_17020 [Longimicrobiales bacterium]|nr:hypothetical protein [Longimicrobiales bacterium]
MQSWNQGSTVLLSEAEDASRLVAELSARTGPAAWYANVGEMLTERPFSSVSVLVLHGHTLPKGTLLATLGRMHVEHPEIQKVAVLDEEPPLPIAEYLASCGVSLLWNGNSEEGADRLASVVNQLHEKTRWIAS